jgi:hypothetical protein
LSSFLDFFNIRKTKTPNDYSKLKIWSMILSVPLQKRSREFSVTIQKSDKDTPSSQDSKSLGLGGASAENETPAAAGQAPKKKRRRNGWPVDECTITLQEWRKTRE